MQCSHSTNLPPPTYLLSTHQPNPKPNEASPTQPHRQWLTRDVAVKSACTAKVQQRRASGMSPGDFPRKRRPGVFPNSQLFLCCTRARLHHVHPRSHTLEVSLLTYSHARSLQTQCRTVLVVTNSKKLFLPVPIPIKILHPVTTQHSHIPTSSLYYTSAYSTARCAFCS